MSGCNVEQVGERRYYRLFAICRFQDLKIDTVSIEQRKLKDKMDELIINMSGKVSDIIPTCGVLIVGPASRQPLFARLTKQMPCEGHRLR